MRDRVIFVYRIELAIDMAFKKKIKPGPPKGTVNNPLGKNQYDNIRAEKPLTVRLLKEQDELLRSEALAQGKTLTEYIDDVVAFYLANRP
ncbi:MAG: hypothetical protein N5P05_003069 [Chroococcopsis gigantea SAG 12.99]|nr:hypothetical protein [Chroococcopsis gigantea SAG 12.99]